MAEGSVTLGREWAVDDRSEWDDWSGLSGSNCRKGTGAAEHGIALSRLSL